MPMPDPQAVPLEPALSDLYVRTWYYAATNAGRLYRLPKRLPEYAWRGMTAKAGAMTPAWIDDEGGIRVFGALVLKADEHDARGVLGFGVGYIDVYRDVPERVMVSRDWTVGVLRQLAAEICLRATVPRSIAWPLSEYLIACEQMHLPACSYQRIGDVAPRAMYESLGAMLRARTLPYFDLRTGATVPAQRRRS